MCLSGGTRPDFRAIDYFCGKSLKDTFEGIFTQVVEVLHSEGFVSPEVQFTDGTKIESASNKYTFVRRGTFCGRVPGSYFPYKKEMVHAEVPKKIREEVERQ